jgi:hypothetical protein
MPRANRERGTLPSRSRPGRGEICPYIPMYEGARRMDTCERCGRPARRLKNYLVGARLLRYCTTCYVYVTRHYRPIGANESNKITTEKEGTYYQYELPQ